MSDPSPRARSRRKALYMPNSGPNSAGSLHLDEWRANVNTELAESARMLQQANIILERHTNHLDDMERRIAKLENAPIERERQVIGFGGLIGQGFYILLSVTAILIALLSPHIAFH